MGNKQINVATVLIIKTSSLGDVIHTLPALTDAARAVPGIRFDWVVEEAFAEIPAWHPAVDRVIPVALRCWRGHPVDTWRRGAWGRFKGELVARRYDAVIDAQGLLKSAWLTRQARGRRFGPDRRSAREPVASRFYDVPLPVAKGQHAVERVRQLFAQALGYEMEYGIDGEGQSARGESIRGEYGLVLPAQRAAPQAASSGERQYSEHQDIEPHRSEPLNSQHRDAGGMGPSGSGRNTVVLLHGTAWPTKHWPERSWEELSGELVRAGYRVVLPWGDEAERLRAWRVADASGARVLARMGLTELAGLMAEVAGCVSVDTGLGHLAAAVGCPTVSLFGPTHPGLTGFYGRNQVVLHSGFPCAPCLRRKCRYAPEAGTGQWPPCFEELSARRVFEAFMGNVGGER
uniref:Lipopolysaccharide heptosyltransferase 1 n=1 Tax=Candidatus Kentrum sp. FM TaxID=2126340 RepID=A0A450WG28_9GAMM|nr:MAG: heptosyltransferase-1 [Candidatus Kentron sp. FM]VFJ70421.1 MAG: heptosyltransferase-1 [Candidatus Kentron sp. FM]VFK15952.1 MAG: heptosyltransferase-1 [Candidatus Kentron sp. FM]